MKNDQEIEFIFSQAAFGHFSQTFLQFKSHFPDHLPKASFRTL